jgi:phosphonate transport system ATP-binding protein
MDALHRVNVEFGITVLANLHSIDLARQYCDRLIGLSAGRLVFDGSPAELTDSVVRDLYGLESDEITDGQAAGAWATRPTIGRIAAAH